MIKSCNTCKKKIDGCCMEARACACFAGNYPHYEPKEANVKDKSIYGGDMPDNKELSIFELEEGKDYVGNDGLFYKVINKHLFFSVNLSSKPLEVERINLRTATYTLHTPAEQPKEKKRYYARTSASGTIGWYNSNKSYEGYAYIPHNLELKIEPETGRIYIEVEERA
jgi:hypothetical protein